MKWHQAGLSGLQLAPGPEVAKEQFEKKLTNWITFD